MDLVKIILTLAVLFVALNLISTIYHSFAAYQRKQGFTDIRGGCGGCG
jgi:hypothetical protein|tara:strand:- start:1087 stop:1230 length:144 start_codon:yes stop_codon:yes gene_type:complete